ncbi:transposable element Tcb1 transposase [Trichonephila clavipes]|nr:transposable element Tcb1 transposase [Trichonephila clavipes]
MVWCGIRFHCLAPLVRIAGKLNCQRYIFEILETVVLPYIQCLPPAIFQQDNARPHVTHNVQELFTHLIELFHRPACSPDLSPIENVWSGPGYTTHCYTRSTLAIYGSRLDYCTPRIYLKPF